MATIYFAKMNINEQIYDVYEGKTTLNSLLTKIYTDLSTTVKVHDKFGAKIKVFDLDRNEDNTTIVGHLAYIKPEIHSSYDENNDTAKDTKDPDSMEYLTFYFDVHKELIGFTTVSKMRQRKALEFLARIIKKSTGIGVEFIIEPNFGELHSRLLEFKTLKKLKVKLVPPNGDDRNFDKLFSIDAARFQQSRATQAKQEFSTRTAAGLDMNSELVKNQITGAELGFSELEFEGKNHSNDQVKISTSDDVPYTMRTSANEARSKSIIAEKSRAGIASIEEYRTRMRLKENNGGENKAH